MIKAAITNKKNIAIAASVLLLLVCYRLNFSLTIEAWKTNEQLKEKLEAAQDLSVQPGFSARKSKNLDEILKRYRSDSTALRENTIKQIAIIANKEKVRLAEVPLEDPSLRNDQYILERLSFEGDLYSLLRTLKDLEASEGVGMPRTVEISAGKKDGPTKLSMKILQEISK